MEVIVVVAARSSSLMIPTALGAWEGGDGLGFFDCMLSTTRQVFFFRSHSPPSTKRLKSNYLPVAFSGFLRLGAILKDFYRKRMKIKYVHCQCHLQFCSGFIPIHLAKRHSRRGNPLIN